MPVKSEVASSWKILCPCGSVFSSELLKDFATEQLEYFETEFINLGRVLDDDDDELAPATTA